MSRDISIIVSAKDNYTTALTKMQKTQTTFRKDLSELNKELTKLNSNKVTLKTDLTQAQNQLKEAKKAFSETGTEMARLQQEAAQANYDNVKSNLDLVSRAAKQTERDMQNLTGVISKTENRMGSAGGESGLLSQLSKAGLINMAGTSLAGLGGAMATSALGQDAGNALMSVLGGAASGAAMGSMAGPVGALVGGIVGAVSGGVQAYTQQFEAKDDAYRSAVSDLYTMVTESQQERLANGIEVAARREQSQIAFSTMLGSDEKAAEFLEKMNVMAMETPFGEQDLTDISRTLLAYNFDETQIPSLLTKVGDAGSALGLASDDIVDIATSLGRMNLTNKASLLEINPLLKRGINVYEYLSKSLSNEENMSEFRKSKDKDVRAMTADDIISEEEVQALISKGLIKGKEAAQVLMDYMGAEFEGGMEKQSESYLGLLSTMEDLQDNIDAAMGRGYEDERKKGLIEQIEYMEGEGGDRMKEANEMIGAWEASMENRQEELEREAIDRAFAEIETQGITEAAEMGAILAAAKAEAQANYASTEEFAQYQAAQIDIAKRIQEDAALNEQYYMAGYDLGQQFSKGALAAMNSINASSLTAGDFASIGGSKAFGGGGHAYGQQVIPYDNYPIMAHQGEVLLTAGQAREYEGGGGRAVNLNVGELVVREEADIERIAYKLYDLLSTADAGYVGGDA